MRHCLWRDKDLQKKNPHLAAWGLVCKPKKQGGLGVLNLAVQNDCLQMKQVHKFYNRTDLTWVNLAWELYYTTALPPARSRDISFWWRDCLKTLPTYKNLDICTFVQGNSILLWQDTWSDIPLKLKWPHLFSFAKNESVSLKEALASPHIPDLFHLPISEEALVQLNLFQALLQDLLPSAENDSWTMLGNSSLPVSKVYKRLMGDVRPMPALDWM
jgi:hypothetical protein